ncbi:MAG: L,D-transpeptidase family protein [Actinobacteria bacterium]|uniref:Unannotated protein n=1 Tax=freshwater metagenome TaxID=449393 RepID=A0A6J5Z6M2_9ZZZZ|nr:L,D-transpeptidase family protein [Actinomycetota bacterium]
MSRSRAVAPLAVCFALMGTATASALPSNADPQPPRRGVASTATLLDDAPVYKKPGAAKRVKIASAFTAWTGSQTVLLVLRSHRDADNRLWLRVLLPVRPNQSSGWILASHAKLGTTEARVEISLRSRSLRVRRAGRIVMSVRSVIGAPATPTPRGLFAIYERAASPRGASIGPFALHLTAFSEVLHSYDGGPGRVAIHGRAGALLGDPLGSAASHGCIRINNSALRRVAGYAKAGTPVAIANGWPSLPSAATP